MCMCVCICHVRERYYYAVTVKRIAECNSRCSGEQTLHQAPIKAPCDTSHLSASAWYWQRWPSYSYLKNRLFQISPISRDKSSKYKIDLLLSCIFCLFFGDWHAAVSWRKHCCLSLLISAHHPVLWEMFGCFCLLQFSWKKLFNLLDRFCKDCLDLHWP